MLFQPVPRGELAEGLASPTRDALAKPTRKDFSRVKPMHSSSLDSRGQTARCRVAGWTAYRVASADLPSLRQQPLVLQGTPLAPSFLKHADEQTIAGLTAVAKVLREHGLEDTDFSQWGVIASPRFLGRAALAVALSRFAAEGAWGISPHLIPHRSLHALSGTVSQALKIHGPNYGVGGGIDGAAEALLAASALLANDELPGLWVVLTGYDPELVPGDPLDNAAQPSAANCMAVALALIPPGKGHAGPVLSVGAGEGGCDLADLTLEQFADTLANGEPLARWNLPCGGWAAWDDTETAVEICL
ncbi:MAG TPA: hypothetical protein VE988_27315 [Gemmataceae bacterium]|nr:hypothetical protein [Gemmataceae bacterium]